MLLLYCVYGYRRGRFKKLYGEAYRILRSGTALTTGLSLFSFLGRAFGKMAGPETGALLAFLIAYIVPYLLLISLRRRIRNWLKDKLLKEESKKWGGVLGLLHSLIMGTAIVIAATLGQATSVPGLLTKGSLLVKLCVALMGG